MGFFDRIGKAAGDAFGGLYHAVTGTMNASEKRQQSAMINGQINYYKQQTELAQSEIARKREEEMAEKRRLEGKQIRALRRNFRPAGFLDSAGGEGVSDKLGG
jgi:hypothetical protein